ncbi:MAG: exopolyphosphatase [Leptospirillia bacterium]
MSAIAPGAFLKSLFRGGPRSWPDWVAAVDLGSNSFHMLVAQVKDGHLNIADKVSEMVRLGGGIQKDGTLAPEVEERALACLERFSQRLSDLPPEAVRVVGTNTIRQLGERSPFVARAEAVLGWPIQVISGIEEARLIYSGVAADLEVTDGHRLVMDIGGGSTELIVGEGLTPLYLESLPMGCVALTTRHFADGKLDLARLEGARLDARRILRPAVGLLKGVGWQQAIGASGTFKALERIVLCNGWAEAGITVEAMEKVAERLVAAGRIDAIEIDGLSAQRTPVIAGGWAVAKALMDGLGLERISGAQGAMREGVLYDLLGRVSHDNIRARTVDALCSRYHVDDTQGAAVADTALTLLAEVAKPWKVTGDDPARFLKWAARLHEIGRDVAQSGYHKHGAYVLANADLPGFSRQDQEILSALVRTHRRKFRAAQMRNDLPDKWGETAVRLAVLLRLAVILHRGRTMAHAPSMALTPSKNGLTLQFAEGWLNDHPLTRDDLAAEAELLAPDFTLTVR